MITIKFYLDNRMVKDGCPSNLKIAIIYKLKATYIPLGVKVLPKNWDSKQGKVVRQSDKDDINMYISNRKNEIDKLVYGYINEHIDFANVYEIKDRILYDLSNKTKNENLFAERFKKFASQKEADKTKSMYLFTLKRLTDFDPNIGCKKFEEIFLNRMNDNLKRIGEVEYCDHGKKIIKPAFPELSTYWARHSWATIASQLDIPRDVIAHAFGHGNNTVTDIYINFDMNKVDIANRQVIDYLLQY